MSTLRSRNICFDMLKGLACIAVVFMHCEFPGTIGIAVQCMTRWSVPLFFAVSGYFFRKDEPEECIRKAKHVLNIILWAVSFYIVFTTIEHILIGDLMNYIKAEFTVVNILALLLFNGQVYVAGHLWFLFALLYVYLFYALMIKTGLTQCNKQICVVLFCFHFILAYGGYLTGHALPAGLYRNWLFDGIPSFLLGNLFYTSQNHRLTVMKPPALILGGFVLAILERALLGRDFSVHIGSIITLCGMIMLAKENRPLGYTGTLLSKIGGGIATYVYIFHIAVYKVIDYVFSFTQFGQNTLFLWMRPVLTVIITVILSICIKTLEDKSKCQLKKH